jgi:serine phosphatase RsbU (regulator of sigma subunit)
VLVLVGALVVTGLLSWGANRLVTDQAHRLLVERANEVRLLLSTSLATISTEVSSLAAVPATSSPEAFGREAASFNTGTSSSSSTWALLRRTPTGYSTIAVVGPGLKVGQPVSPSVASTLEAAPLGQMVATPLSGAGAKRSIGFAYPTANGEAVYREIVVGPVRAPAQASNSAFSDVKVVLYASSTPDPTKVLVSTAPTAAISGVQLPLMAGSTTWLMVVAPVRPLVGSLAQDSPLVVLLGGVVIAILAATLVELILRRRDQAIQLYEAEHRFAEGLQRHLLPDIPTVGGLDMAARYVAAGSDQQVGGDWFDVFELDNGLTAVAIGDVMGHDVRAAQAMAQIRASLRAYALEVADPGSVVDRLAHLVDTFSIAALVSLLYGTLSPMDEGGQRCFRWSNAGHLPPLVRSPDGEVKESPGGRAAILGAPREGPSVVSSLTLAPKASLVLYTDGLVEIPGGDLRDTIASLQHVVAEQPVEASAEEMCEAIIASQLSNAPRDDVALFLVRNLGRAV